MAQQVEEPLLMALVRQELLAWHHRTFVLHMLEHLPLRGNSKTARSCRTQGLAFGLQGMHARLLTNMRMSVTYRSFDDPIFPLHPSSIDPQVLDELVDTGISHSAAQRILNDLAVGMSKAALECRKIQNELLLQGDRGGCLRVLDRDSFILLSFEPEHKLAEIFLRPVRSRDQLPNKDNVGSVNYPLFDQQREHLDTLLSCGLMTSDFTAVLRLNKSHLAKLTKMYLKTKNGSQDGGSLLVDQIDCVAGQRNEKVAPTDRVAGPANVFLPEDMRDTTRFIAAETDDEFLRKLFRMVARYETFTGNTAGLQGSISQHAFGVLESLLGVTQECFASPLNCHFPNFYSAFPDTDAAFGSLGDFFENFWPTEGFFQANPPFVVSVADGMVERFLMLLGEADIVKKELVFVVVVPSWVDANFHRVLETTRYCFGAVELKRKEHHYVDGLQHRSDRSTWAANTESTWFLLASTVACERLDAINFDWSGVVYQACGHPGE